MYTVRFLDIVFKKKKDRVTRYSQSIGYLINKIEVMLEKF